MYGSRADAAKALEGSERGLAIAGEEPALSDLRLLLAGNRAEALIALDRIDEARQCVLDVRRLAERIGNMTRLLLAQSMLVALLFATGRWDNALSESEADPQFQSAF
jgi:hypothetical protein